jgi:two-component system, OmpR family, sensor kinase
VSRLPLRIRLTLAFAAAMAVVLAVVGAFVYVRLGDSLTEQLDESLEGRAAALAPLVAQDGEPLEAALGSTGDEALVQIVSSDGTIVGSTPGASGQLVSTEELERAANAAMFVQRDSIEAFDGEAARLLLTPVRTEARTSVLVVGASLEERREALNGLLAALAIGGPLALLAASVAGYLVAGAALRPVEAMRRRAAEVSSDEPGARLPLPEANDEIRRLGTTLNEMLERLEDGLERERRFTADASHELRTPLALLETELELALRRPRSREELEQALRSAAEEVDRLRRLADDLLVLAQLDRGRVPLRREPIAADDLLGTIARRFAPRAEAEGRSVEVVGATGVQLAGDRLRLEQALGNLVDNALRHGAGPVRLEASSANGVVELRVADDGPGFPPGFLPRAFERFSRPDDARSGGTAGLGLAIVDAVAQAHGGTARASNKLGAVTIVLPLDGKQVPG